MRQYIFGFMLGMTTGTILNFLTIKIIDYIDRKKEEKYQKVLQKLSDDYYDEVSDEPTEISVTVNGQRLNAVESIEWFKQAIANKSGELK